MTGAERKGVFGSRSADSPRAGFTMMEILVVLAVFSTVSVAVADLFLLSSRAQRRTGEIERVQTEGRFVLEYIVQHFKSGTVAYDRMSEPIAEPSETLVVRSASGGVSTFSVSPDPVECGRAATPCLLLTYDEGGVVTRSPLTPPGLAVKDLKFFVYPDVDPNRFDPALGGYAADAQPIVTIALSLAPIGKPEQAISVQTAVASRTYAR